MKSEHPNDNFADSEASFLNAAEYWERFLTRFGFLERRDWKVIGLSRGLDGSLDMMSGVLFTIGNVAAKRCIRLSQSNRRDTGSAVIHLSKRELDRVECNQLNIHCSPTHKIEGVIALLFGYWMDERNTSAGMTEILAKFLPNDVYEDDGGEQIGSE